ncbi:heavy metal-associated isoprenylated plant protein 47-like [Corylus avellana]|uniref:heavy metal-associated isoprenylated plant protein 47-like n=1 Tax=Corylus avellana TaxID=13451 RepID=UPI00286A4391|nr:heavy metal-associated isoprenylated plant protein 47-like [Corylus avellana]
MVIKVQMNNDRRRTRAMKIAAAAYGVSSVAIQGPEKDELVVSGEDIDSVNLTRSLRRKLCYAAILSVEEVKANAGTASSASLSNISQFPAYYQPYQPFPKYYEVVHENNCSIM